MEKTLKALNELERKGLVETYAIGGAIASLFYTEPIPTYDLHIFVLLPEGESGLAVLSPIYDYFRHKGCKVEQEHIGIEGIPVQFIPAFNDLIREAVREARETRVGKA